MLRLGLLLNGTRGMTIAQTALSSSNAGISWVIAPRGSKLVESQSSFSERGVEIYQVATASELLKLSERCEDVDIIISAGFPYRIPRLFFSKSKILSCNFHGGPLPSYRGGSPLNWQIINGESIIKLTVHVIEEEFDTGDILLTSSFEMSREWDISHVQNLANEHFSRMFRQILSDPLSILLRKKSQSKANAQYWHQRSEQDGEIVWSVLDSLQVCQLVRAITLPYPGAHARLSSGELVKIWKVKVDDTPICGIPGRVVFQQGTPHVVCAKNTSVELFSFESTVSLKNGMRFL